MTLIDKFKAARVISTPIVGITTADPAAIILEILESIPKTATDPIIRWDRTRGMVGINDPAVNAIEQLIAPYLTLGDDPTAPAPDRAAVARAATAEPEDALRLALDLPKRSILFMVNAHRFLEKPEVMQATWNLRDKFKENGRMLVMLAPNFDLPAELSHDVLIFDEPLPSPEQLQRIVIQGFTNFGMPAPDEKTTTKGVDALRGLAHFPADQAVAMCLNRTTGLDINALWDRKRQMISQTPGLSVYNGPDRFADIGGLTNVKTFLTRAFNGKRAPRVVVVFDEIEKDLAGTTSDSSGVSQEQHGGLLTNMQNTNVAGLLAIGPPGAAKTALAKALGNEGGVLVILFNLAAMKDKYVGASNARLTQAFKVVSAVSDNQALYYATCNSIANLSTEIRRRFTFGTFFFDLPTADERKVIWSIYLKKFGLKGTLPPNEGWTGAEIKQCCDIADRLNISLVEAAEYIVPIAESASDKIEKLRMQASGNYISASYKGKYRYEGKKSLLTAEAPSAGGRAITHA